ncbi:MAG TPA: efflux RND transporter periplasmic adaptor subunit [Fluviicoccus sp.]|nr:efflux RND transporter periplasmic adaptor subunit [Fluviicoccus sp.]
MASLLQCERYALITACLWLAGCGGGDPAVKPVAMAMTPPLELSAADIVKAPRGRLQPETAFTGQLAPLNQTTLQAEVAARVDRVLVRPGDSVAAGQVLAVLSTRELEARLRQAEAAVAGARAQSVLAEAVRDRQQALRVDNNVSELELKRSVAEAEAAAENVRAQTALLVIARKALDEARIMAPMAGVISRRLIQPGQTVAVNTPLFELVDLNPLELTGTVPSAAVAALAPGQRVHFRVQGLDREFVAAVTRINPLAEPGSRALVFYALVANADYMLKGGLYVQGRLATAREAEGVILPLAALRGGHEVMIVSDGKLVKRQVAVLARNNDLVVVSGLTGGETVLTTRLADGALGRSVRMAE